MLKRTDWHLESAVDTFFSASGGGGFSAGPRVDTAKIGKLFDSYRGALLRCPEFFPVSCLPHDLEALTSEPVVPLQMRVKRTSGYRD
eukprot:scaffold61589_cov29-Tisochrysis_lutea.AAC.2